MNFFLVVFLVFIPIVSSEDVEVIHDGEYEEPVDRYSPNHEEEEDDSLEIRGQSNNPFDNMSERDLKSHFKDIIRGFSDKGFDECDMNKDGYLDISEIAKFINEKMGFLLKVAPGYVIHHYDVDGNKKLNKDEVWMIVENKDPALFKIRPEIMEQNMMVMQGVQPEHFDDDDEVNDYEHDEL